jgi:hypothetical protein
LTGASQVISASRPCSQGATFCDMSEVEIGGIAG